MSEYDNYLSLVKVGEEIKTLQPESDIHLMEKHYGGIKSALAGCALPDESKRIISEHCDERIRFAKARIEEKKEDDNAKSKKTFREKYWWLIGLGGLIFGIFTPGLSEMVKLYILQMPKKEIIILQTDTVVVKKTDTVYLPDSLLKKKTP